MTDATTLDTDAVDRWLSENLPGYEGPLEAQKFAQGQSNPTFRLVTPARTYVLRRKPPEHQDLNEEHAELPAASPATSDRPEPPARSGSTPSATAS